MAEYIKRQEVCSKINELPLTEDAAMEILWAIDDIPTADVAPVVHAHRTVNVGMRSYCSNCGHLAHCENYCSICGAKMDLDGDPNDP